MRAVAASQAPHPVGRLHGVRVAVIFEAGTGLIGGSPGRHHLHEQPDGGRREHAVRPDHLRFAAGGAIFLRLLLKPRVGENAKAPEAWPARGRQDDLAEELPTCGQRGHPH